MALVIVLSYALSVSAKMWSRTIRVASLLCFATVVSKNNDPKIPLHHFLSICTRIIRRYRENLALAVTAPEVTQLSPWIL